MRRWLTAISAAITGNVTGAMGDMVQAAAINYLQGLAASEVKRITANLGDGAEAEAARAAMHAIVGCAGAAGKGGNCSAGALGAGAGSVINALLSGDQKKLDPEEKEARRNLVESLVAGIALAAGTSVVDAAFAAINETENNALSVPEHQARIEEMALCNRDRVCELEVARKYKKIDDGKRQELKDCVTPDACRKKIEEATVLLAQYASRVGDLEEKLRTEGSLSASEQEELAILKIHAPVLLEADRNAAIKNLIVMGGDETKQLVWDEIAKAGAAGAAAAVGAVGSTKSGNAAIGAGSSGKAPPVPQITLNRQNGIEFEKQVVAAFEHVGGVKNNIPVTVSVNGISVTTIPDMWGKSVGGMLEVKNVQSLSMSDQLRAQILHAKETGQPLNLVVSPRTSNVSRMLQQEIRETGGNVYRYNPSSNELTNF